MTFRGPAVCPRRRAVTWSLDRRLMTRSAPRLGAIVPDARSESEGQAPDFAGVLPRALGGHDIGKLVGLCYNPGGLGRFLLESPQSNQVRKATNA